MEASHSFFLYFYENIHNIAYNVFYNHEYRLPTVCRDFDRMVEHLKKETGIQVNGQEPTKRVRAVVTPAVENPFGSSLETSSGDSSGDNSSDSSKSPPPKQTFKRLQAVGGPGLPGVRSDGGSSRTRRQRKKQTTRTRRRHNKRSGK
jgi:hypothetical protein